MRKSKKHSKRKYSRRKNKDHLFGKRTYKSQKKQRHYKVHKRKYRRHLKPMSVPAVEITAELHEKRPRKRRSKNGVSRMYFTQETEDAIILYNKTEDQTIREQIFQDKIHYPFQKLVENVFNTFKFSYFETGPLDVQKECLPSCGKYAQVRSHSF